MKAATTSSRGRKRLRREEEDTPPRVSLEELEQQDRAQQKPTPGRAVLNQPLAAADQQLTPGRSGLNQPRAVANQQMTPGGAVLEQPQAAAKPEATGGKSAIKHHGQSSMTDFLTIAPAAQTGLSAAKRGLQEVHSDGETLCRTARVTPALQMHTQHTDMTVSALGILHGLCTQYRQNPLNCTTSAAQCLACCLPMASSVAHLQGATSGGRPS
jgi:hypothetical protein